MAVSKKSSKPASPSTLHPPYLKMITEAISSLRDRTGSSQPAIAKFMEDRYSSLLPPNFKKILSVQLKKFVKSEKLVKIKNSYMISSSEKEKLNSRKRNDVEKPNPNDNNRLKKAVAKKGEKFKRLSQVKTPEVLKKKEGKKTVTGGKMKPLSQVKTPEAMKKKNKVSITARRNASRSVKSSRAAVKKARI